MNMNKIKNIIVANSVANSLVSGGVINKIKNSRFREAIVRVNLDNSDYFG